MEIFKIVLSVPVSETENFVSAMSKILGEKSCYILKVRSHGGCEI